MMNDVLSAEEVLKKTAAVAQYYGFAPLTFYTKKARDEGRIQKNADFPESLKSIELDMVGRSIASFLKQYRATGDVPMAHQPVFVWHTNIAPGRNAPKKALIQFHALGTDHTLADAVLIRAVLALVRDLFRKDPTIRINSMGDKETRARYSRELATFFKKHANALPDECIACSKRDTLEAAELAIKKECAEDLPAPTDSLSDASRKRFEELLEYLEATETPYELARNLISRGTVWNEVCFEVCIDDTPVAWGSRYHELARHFFPTALPSVGALFQITTTGEMVAEPKNARTRFVFVHIGDEAKRLSIRLAEDFKRARLPLAQDIGVESLTEQLRLAERHDPQYVLIMGRKEALEGSAILRNRLTQEESLIPLESLVDRLRTV